MYYGYKCVDENKSWEGYAGCWGVMAFRNKDRHITEINFCLSDSFSNGSMAHAYAKELNKSTGVSVENAKGQVFDELCKTFLGKHVKWELKFRTSETRPNEHKWWVTITDFQDMPKNHTLYLLFGLRSALTGLHSHMWENLRNRGIKSVRKMFIGCSMFCQQSGMNGLTGLCTVPGGGKIFMSAMTTLKDITDFYRGNKLKGPADEVWGVKGGYSSGNSGRCVQMAGCHAVNSKPMEERVTYKPGMENMSAAFPLLGRVSNNVKGISDLFDQQAAFLKALK